MYTIVSDVSVRRSVFAPGDRVDVLYLPADPENACLDAFTPLWLSTVVPAVVGFAFLTFPALILVAHTRQRASEPP
jgi:hypothetical protein